MSLLSNNFDWICLVVLGSASGFASGLLGIGGGLVIVPALIFALPRFGISGPEIPKIAMATSLALIVPTSIASAQAHLARRAVDWPMLGILAPSVIVGAFLSATLVPKFNTHLVVLLFVTFAVVTSWRLLLRGEEGATETLADVKPAAAETVLKGAAGGGVAAVLGIGGAFFIIPILLRLVPMQRAIGTASALAIPLSIAGSAGYVLAEAPPGCPHGCVGYVFFPAVAAVGISAVLAAPLGAWLAHHAPAALLRRLFALFLTFAAGNLAYKAFSPALGDLGAPGVATIIEGHIREQPSLVPPRPERAVRHQRRPSRQYPRTAEPPEPSEPEPAFSSLPSEPTR